jgi:hypothetical protein
VRGESGSRAAEGKRGRRKEAQDSPLESKRGAPSKEDAPKWPIGSSVTTQVKRRARRCGWRRRQQGCRWAFAWRCFDGEKRELGSRTPKLVLEVEDLGVVVEGDGAEFQGADAKEAVVAGGGGSGEIVGAGAAELLAAQLHFGLENGTRGELFGNAGALFRGAGLCCRRA